MKVCSARLMAAIIFTSFFVHAPAYAVNTVIDTITVGIAPKALAVDEIADRLYVANFGASTVTVVNTANDGNLEIDTISVGLYPRAVAVDGGAKRLYVAISSSNTVSVFNTANNQKLADISVGPQPVSLAIDKVANRLYVAHEGQPGGTGQGWVSVIDTGTYQKLDMDFAFGYKVAVAVDEDARRLYVANHGRDGTVSVFDITNVPTLVTTLDFNARVANVAVDESADRLYVSTYGLKSELVVFDSSNDTRITNIDLPLRTHSFGLAAHASHPRVYIANFESNAVRVIDTFNDANTFDVRIPVGGGPVAIAINVSTGRVYVANSYSGTVSVIQIEKEGEANLSIAIKDDSDSPVFGGTDTLVMPGDTIVYTVTVTNAGPSLARSVFLVDTVPSGFIFNPGASSQTQCPPPTGADVVCFLGDIAQGEERVVTLTFDAPQVDSPIGMIYNYVEVLSPTDDANYSDNTAVESTFVYIAYDLTITLEDDEDPLIGPFGIFDGILYTATVTNNGPQTAIGVQIQNPVPAWGDFFGFLSPPGWTLLGGDFSVEPYGTVVFDVPELAPQASVSADILLRPSPSLRGWFVNAVTVSAVGDDLNPLSNADSETTELIERRTLTSGSIVTFALPFGEQGTVNISLIDDPAASNYTPPPWFNISFLNQSREAFFQIIHPGTTCMAGCTITYTLTRAQVDWIRDTHGLDPLRTAIYHITPPNDWTRLPTSAEYNPDGTVTLTATTYLDSIFVVGITTLSVGFTILMILTLVLVMGIIGFVFRKKRWWKTRP